MKKTFEKPSPFKLISPVESNTLPISTPQFMSTNIQSPVDSWPGKDDDQNLVKYIKEDADLNKQINEAGNKLVLIAFFLLGVDRSDNILMNLISKTKKYQNSLVILVVDVATIGEVAKKYEASQIPWFTFMKNSKVLQAYHSVHIDRIQITIQKHLSFSSSSSSENSNTIRSYIKNNDDLNRRLTDAGKNLVVLAFLITDDDAGQRLNMELDGIEEREKGVEILKVDVDLCQEVAEKYNIQGVPTLVFLKNQVIVDQFMGTDSERIHNAITKYKIPEEKISIEEVKHELSKQVSKEMSKEASSSIGLIAEPTKKSFDQDDE